MAVVVDMDVASRSIAEVHDTFAVNVHKVGDLNMKYRVASISYSDYEHCLREASATFHVSSSLPDEIQRRRRS